MCIEYKTRNIGYAIESMEIWRKEKLDIHSHSSQESKWKRWIFVYQQHVIPSHSEYVTVHSLSICSPSLFLLASVLWARQNFIPIRILLLILFYVCEYMCIVWTVCTWMRVYAPVSIVRLEEDTEYPHISFSTLFLWGICSHFWARLPGSKTQRYSCPSSH